MGRGRRAEEGWQGRGRTVTAARTMSKMASATGAATTSTTAATTGAASVVGGRKAGGGGGGDAAAGGGDLRKKVPGFISPRGTKYRPLPARRKFAAPSLRRAAERFSAKRELLRSARQARSRTIFSKCVRDVDAWVAPRTSLYVFHENFARRSSGAGSRLTGARDAVSQASVCEFCYFVRWSRRLRVGVAN